MVHSKRKLLIPSMQCSSLPVEVSVTTLKVNEMAILNFLIVQLMGNECCFIYVMILIIIFNRTIYFLYHKCNKFKCKFSSEIALETSQNW